MTDLIVAFVLLVFMLVLLCFFCCYRFTVNLDGRSKSKLLILSDYANKTEKIGGM